MEATIAWRDRDRPPVRWNAPLDQELYNPIRAAFAVESARACDWSASLCLLTTPARAIKWEFRLCRREPVSEPGLDCAGLLWAQRSRPVELLGKPSRVVERVAADLESPENGQAAIGEEHLWSHEAEASLNLDIGCEILQCRLYGGYLSPQPVEQLGPVVAGDLQLRRSEKRLANLDLSSITLGIDDVHPGGRDGDVIDIRPAMRHLAIVKHRNPGAPTGEGLSDKLLTMSSTRPALLLSHPPLLLS